MPEAVQLGDFLLDPADLPTLPAIATELLSIAEWEEIDVRKLSDLIGHDPSLASRILHVVNSSFYGFPRKIGTLSQAIVALGIQATRSLALTYSVLSLAPRGRTEACDYGPFWSRALSVAMAARELARAAEIRAEEEAFLGGLLQDLGMIALQQKLGDRYAELQERFEPGTPLQIEAERRELGTDHAVVGKHLLETWQFPPELVEPVFHHHGPAPDPPLEPDLQRMCGLQAVAGAFGGTLFAGNRRNELLPAALERARKGLGLSADAVEEALRRADAAVQESAPLFDIAPAQGESFAGLFDKAARMVTRMVGEREILIRRLEAAGEDALKLSEQLRVANNQLLDEARRDPLTGLANRRALREHLDRELERHVRYEAPLTVLFTDVDGFKLVNDSWGHDCGDAVLRHVAQVLKEGVRQGDLVSRYGGEEFVMVLSNAPEAVGARVAERVRMLVEEKGEIEGCPAPVTLSIGLATWTPKEPFVTGEQLIARADGAMYEAKRSGKNRVCPSPCASEEASG